MTTFPERGGGVTPDLRGRPGTTQSGHVSPSFTLLELLIVIGILAALAAVVAIVINPADKLQQARDVRRIAELSEINRVLGYYDATVPNSSFGLANKVYVSLPDDVSSTCASWTGLPPLPTGWSYNCATSANFRKLDGNGWIPVNFTAMPGGSPFAALPIDPVNNASYYYTYVTGGSWELTSQLESARYASYKANDGGPDPAMYEVGSNLKLSPFLRGLVGYWSFDEGSGTTANDSSGNGNNGNVVGSVTWVSGVSGNALSFPAAGGNYMRAGTSTSLSITGDVTVAVWVKRTGGDTGYAQLGSKVSNAGPIAWGLHETYGSSTGNFAPYMIARIGNVEYSAVSPNSLPLNTWRHIVGVRSGTSIILYENGMAVANTTVPSGAMDANDLNYFNINNDAGSIAAVRDELRVYNRALSDAEIAAIYSATK